jgi:ribonuclease P protein component
VRSADRYFTILARASEQTTPRLGLTVSKRVAKRAVDRNRVKRLARETFRQLNELPNWDFVVLARPAAASATKAELRRSLERLFARLSKTGRMKA